MSTFADRLRELRGSESQASFASAIGVNRIQYAKYEGGVNSPKIEILERICRVHSVSSDWLLGLKPSSNGNVAVSGSGNAVAIGTGAKASARTVHTAKRESDCCAKCPHKILADAVRKAAAK